MEYLKLITKHKAGQEYTKVDLANFIDGYLDGSINDQLMTKFLASIYDYGLSVARTADLTNLMIESGSTIDLSDIPGIKVDKHSTGGVGDKISLIIMPIVAALGAKVAKMAGKGLGFTGGTIDKLDSIPGFQTILNNQEFKNILKKHDLVLTGQTQNLVPADQKIYALRDVTNLVDSIPLIASSVMAKKLATGADAILLDVKCGDGAFMKDQKSAEKLAQMMIAMGKHLKKDVRAEISTMASPLGKAIGNKIEVLEAMQFLQGKFISEDLEEVVLSSSSTMLLQSKIFTTRKEAEKAIKEILKNGKAFEKFKEWVIAQKGDLKKLLSSNFWLPKYKHIVKAEKDGYMNIKSASAFGLLAMKLGAGRKNKEDTLDYDAGIILNKKSGDQVQKNETLFTLYASTPIKLENLKTVIRAYEIGPKIKKPKTILNQL